MKDNVADQKVGRLDIVDLSVSTGIFSDADYLVKSQNEEIQFLRARLLVYMEQRDEAYRQLLPSILSTAESNDQPYLQAGVLTLAEQVEAQMFLRSRGYRIWQKYLSLYNYGILGVALKTLRRLLGRCLRLFRRALRR